MGFLHSIAFLFLPLLVFVALLGLVMLVLWLKGLTPLFSSPLTNGQFNVLLEVVFSAPNLYIPGTQKHPLTVSGDEYYIICESYENFTVNHVGSFSLYQRYLFFKRFKNYYKEVSLKQLKVHKLTPTGQLLFGNKREE